MGHGVRSCARRWRALVVHLFIAGAVACAPPSTIPSPISADEAVRQAIAREARLDPSSFPSRSVGVMPFVVDPRDSALAPLGYGLADLLITDLARARQLILVDRLRVGAVMRELRLVATGSIDTIPAPRAGRLLGAQRLILGAVHSTPRGELVIETRIAGTVSGRLEGFVSGTAPLDRVLDAEKAVALTLFDRFGITLTPAERAAVEQRPTRNLTALLAYSRGVRDEAMGNLAGASQNYAAAFRLDPGFEIARTRQTDVDARLQRPATVHLVRTETREARPRVGLDRVTALTADGINRGLPLRIPDATDPSFRSAQQVITLVIVVNIP